MWLISLENSRNQKPKEEPTTVAETEKELSEADLELLISIQALVFGVLEELRKREPLPIANRIARFVVDMLIEK